MAWRGLGSWDATRRRSAAGVFGLALVTSAAWLAAGAITPSLGNATSVSAGQGSLKLTPSSSPQAGRPITITESGQVGVTSTLEVFAQLGQGCLASQGQEVAGGALHVDQRVIPAPPGRFTATSRFTPATAGTYYICGYLDGASDEIVEDQAVSLVVIVGPAPTPPVPAPETGRPTTTSCVVPALTRHSLAAAKRLLASSGCSLGVILRPSVRGLSRARRRRGGGSLVLVVGSQFPLAGNRLNADQYVAIRLVLGDAPGIARKTGER